MLKTTAMFFLAILCGCRDFGPRALTHVEAEAKLQAAGFRLSSSENCYDRRNPRCTSLEGIRADTIEGIIAFKALCAECRTLAIVGGTEAGHSTMEYSHEKGYKIDISKISDDGHRLQKSLGSFILNGVYTFKAPSYQYLVKNEEQHWDVTVLKLNR